MELKERNNIIIKDERVYISYRNIIDEIVETDDKGDME